MFTIIKIRSKANPDIVVSSSSHNRRLSAAEVRKEIKTLMKYLDPKKHIIDGPEYVDRI